MRDCSDCELTVAVRQLRTRDLTDCVFNAYAMNAPVVEACSRVTFHPHNGAYAGLSDHLAAARLDLSTNVWNQVCAAFGGLLVLCLIASPRLCAR